MNQKIQPITTCNLGWIPYLNLFPLYCEVQKKQFRQLKILSGHPTKVNKMLREGLVDIAPCSSVCLLSPNYEIAVPIGVAATGKVHSVYLGLKRKNPELTHYIANRNQELKQIFQDAIHTFPTNCRSLAQQIYKEIPTSIKQQDLPNNKIPQVKFSGDSATSNMLCRILMGLWFGLDSVEKKNGSSLDSNTAHSCELELVIGDTALQRINDFEQTIDLGQNWFEITGLPFVYAVFQKLHKRPVPLEKSLLSLAELAEARMKIEPANYLVQLGKIEKNSIRLDLYWQAIRFKLTPLDYQGLLTFLSLTKEFFPGLIDQSAVVKIARWTNHMQSGPALGY